MKRLSIDWKTVKSDVIGYTSEIAWVVLYTAVLFLLTWIISVIPW
jgi:hypothetical protein